MSKHLLPCPACGQKTPVEAGQAGQTLRCTCGQSLEVPTMRGLRSLEQAIETEPLAPRWTKRKGLVFLGSAIVVFALAFGGYLWIQMPAAIDAAAIRAEVNKLDPAAGFIRFKALQPHLPLQQGANPVHLGPSMPLFAYFDHPANQWLAQQQIAQSQVRAKERKELADWFPLIGGIGAVGVLIALSALLVRGDRSRPGVPRKGQAAISR